MAKILVSIDGKVYSLPSQTAAATTAAATTHYALRHMLIKIHPFSSSSKVGFLANNDDYQYQASYQLEGQLLTVKRQLQTRRTKPV
ncbi:MAG: hypothetical protein ACOYNZ_14795 [Rhodoferax sp.]